MAMAQGTLVAQVQKQSVSFLKVASFRGGSSGFFHGLLLSLVFAEKERLSLSMVWVHWPYVCYHHYVSCML